MILMTKIGILTRIVAVRMAAAMDVIAENAAAVTEATVVAATAAAIATVIVIAINDTSV